MVRCWWLIPKMTQTDGTNIYHILGLKEVTLSQWPYYQSNLYQINNDIFHKTKKTLLCTKIQKTLISKMILRKKYRAGGIMFPEFQTILQTDSQQSENEIAQSCPTLCDPIDCRLPGSSVHGIFQARILKWVAISFSSRSSWPRDWTWVSCIVGRWLYHLSHQGSGMMMAQNRNTDQ